MTVFHRKNVSISRRRDTQSFHLISDKNVIHKSDSWPCVAPENKWSTRLRIFSIKHRRDQFFWSPESKLRLRADAPPSFHWVSGLGFADWSINSCLVDCWLKPLRVVICRDLNFVVGVAFHWRIGRISRVDLVKRVGDGMRSLRLLRLSESLL